MDLGNVTVPKDKITFHQLFNATHIELNIIAADLSLRRQVVFSHLDTPNCAVADAVVASSAIPFAFRSRLLQVAQTDNGNAVCHHTIVDGGVWSNFPMFVFEDRAFRKHYHRVPESIEPNQILGFILAEGQEDPSPRGEHVAFVQATSVDQFHPREWLSDHGSTATEPHSWSRGARLGAWLLYPFALLARFLEWNGGMERGRWPNPRSPVARNLVLSINGLLGGHLSSSARWARLCRRHCRRVERHQFSSVSINCTPCVRPTGRTHSPTSCVRCQESWRCLRSVLPF